jgi:hypothetical protein
MSLQLPPERRLDHPDRMIDAILADADAAAEAPEAEAVGVTSLGRRRRTRFLLAAVAAAAVGVVGVVGVSVVGHGQQGGVASPPSLTAAAPSPSPTVIVPGPVSSPGERRTDPAGTGPTQQGPPVIVSVGTPVSFADFTVTVDRLQWTAAQGLLVQAEVCVRKLPAEPTNGNTTRISWDPWTVNSSTASFLPRLADGSHPPADLFPSQDFYRVGECARGWLPFADAPATTDLSAISYRNELGDQAIWVPAGAKADLGRKVAFPYLTVSVNGIIAAGREYAVQVTTCVTKLPPGTPKTGLRLSREPWRLETDHGEVTIDAPLTDVLPLPTTYPQEGRYHVGDCVTGYIPFGISRGAVVDAIRYDNSLGDHAVWLPRH